LKDLFKKYKHGIFFIYLFIYLPCFAILEKIVTTNYYVIHCRFDDLIPFCEYFIIPYDLWFLYIAISYLFFFFVSPKEFVNMAFYLTLGMTTFLIISALWHNGLPTNYRPDLDALGRDNFCIHLVRSLYAADTSTNVFPSIHVFNSIGATIAWVKTKKVGLFVKISAIILCILICLATVFLKQHSIIDVIGAITLAIILLPCYSILTNRQSNLELNNET